jgi:hypothetical protein
LVVAAGRYDADSDGMREKRQQRFGEVLDAAVAMPVVTV